MRSTLFAVALILSVTGFAVASETSAVLAPLYQFMNGLNKGNIKGALAACASPASIIDEFPPHEWQGPTACSDWLNAFNADSKKRDITDEVVTLGTPRHVDITGDRAYVVVPATYSYKQNGRPVSEVGSIWTVALRKFSNGWRMTGWAWAKH
jgi:hypothetical protein